MPVFDISVRISRVGSRAEERLYSDENQERVCREHIEREGGTVGVVTVEKNVSGGKSGATRQIEKLIRRVEEGESNGIVVYDFSRFSREDPFQATMLIGRVHGAGGVVVGVADNYRSNGPMAVVQTAIYAEQAHNYLKVARERSADGVNSARNRGAYVNRTPRGYARDEHGCLVPGAEAHLIPLFFERKLAGDSYPDLQRLAAEHGMRITDGGIRNLLSNRAYIGEGKGGPSPTLVDKEVFERVQQMQHKRKPTGKGATTLSQGIAKCAHCGSTLIVKPTPAGGVYYCRGKKLGGCDSRGSVSIKRLDAWVDSLFQTRAALADRMFRAYSDEDAVEETGKLMDAKRFEYEGIKKSTSLISTLGIEEFERMVADAKASYDIAVAAHAEAKATANVLGGMTSLLAMWRSGDLTLEEKRRLLPKVISRIEVGRGRVALEQKCRIIFSDGTVLAPHDAGPSLSFVKDGDEFAA